jgi:myosin-15
MNTKLRDEIFIQIVNQTWNNEDPTTNLKAWQLMSQCLSCFNPSPCLFKYLLKYCSDHAENGYKAYCQFKLLQSEQVEPQLVRTYPLSLLESKAAKKCSNMLLEANFIDGMRLLLALTLFSSHLWSNSC